MLDYQKIYSNPFMFKGMMLTLNDIGDWETIKVYTKSSHLDRKLLKDKENNILYLYEFYEYVSFGDSGDQIYTTYVVVENEEDADKLNKERDIRRSPYFRVMPNYEIIMQ